MIPPETIEQVRQATDIVALLSEYIQLKRRGQRYLAVCPFHTEKTPSFSVSPDRQLYYCFGCHKGGTVFTFLQEHEGMSFAEAVRFLARKANITIREERESDARREIVERIAFANQVALEYFRRVLDSQRYANIKTTYLHRKRGIEPETMDQFQLGLAGEEWDGLIRFARSKGLTPNDLTDCGLALYSEKSGKHFDRFRQRLIIPIFNLSQKPIAFGGRTLKKGEPAKYINSPETALYSKSNVLFNLNFAKDAIREADSVFVVEGYFDVISLWQAGIKNVVASSGTAFTPQQARLLARFAEEVYLFFDADSAGRNAAMRSVDILYDAGLEVRVVVAPPGEDPDSVAREFGRDRIDELRHDALGYIPFRVQDVDVRSAGIIGREKLVKEFGALGARIGDPTRRSLFFEEAANVLGVEIELLKQVADGTPAPPPPADTAPTASRKQNPVELHLLSILFHNPGSIDTIFEKLTADDFSTPELARLYGAMAQQYRVSGTVDARVLVDTAAQDRGFVSVITSAAAIEWEPDHVDAEARQLLKRLLDEKKKRLRDRLKDQLATAEAAGDQDEARRILEELKSQGL